MGTLRGLWGASIGAALLAPASASAHPRHPFIAADALSVWAVEPWTMLWLGSAVSLYALGIGRLWRRAGAGRGISRRRFWSFCAGVVVLAVALLSPLHGLGGVLFSAHMLQHELLILVAAPLIVVGMPWVAFAWALPREPVQAFARVARSRPIAPAWRTISHPASAAAIHAFALWIWHVPALYEATVSSSTIHAVQHLGFFGSALLLWWAVFRRSAGGWAAGGAVLVIFVTMIHSNALGALLTFASRPWYPSYEATAPLWGIPAIADQQLGGLLMWVPAGAIYLGIALALLHEYLVKGARAPGRAADGR